MGPLNIQQRLHEHSPEMRVCSGQDQYCDPEEKRMRKNTCRVIKIDKEALFEFIYENFIAQEENLLDINNSVDVSNNFAIDWKRSEFIFAAYKDEDEAGHISNMPKLCSPPDPGNPYRFPRTAKSTLRSTRLNMTIAMFWLNEKLISS